MKMVERVARAIAKSAHGDDEGWAGWVDEATAALKALRAPTQAMVDAGRLVTHPAHVFAAMIDAAISEATQKEEER